MGFIDYIQLGVPQSFMGYVEYPKLRGAEREFLWDHNWDIDIPTPPRAIYWPGLEFLKTRLTSMSIEIPKELQGEIRAEIRGFSIIQAGGFKSSGSVTMNFIDFEDQVIFAMANSFLEAGGGNRYKFMLRKPDTIIPEMHVYILNSSRLPVRKYVLYTLVFKSYEANTNEYPTEPGEGRHEVTLTFDYEHFEMIILNAKPSLHF